MKETTTATNRRARFCFEGCFDIDLPSRPEKFGVVKYSRKPLMTERSDKMSVIGRLDDQVEAVLINPLKRRERRDDAEAERDAPSPRPPTASHEERDESARDERREGDAASLPVWLL